MKYNTENFVKCSSVITEIVLCSKMYVFDDRSCLSLLVQNKPSANESTFISIPRPRVFLQESPRSESFPITGGKTSQEGSFVTDCLDIIFYFFFILPLREKLNKSDGETITFAKQHRHRHASPRGLLTSLFFRRNKMTSPVYSRSWTQHYL